MCDQRQRAEESIDERAEATLDRRGLILRSAGLVAAAGAAHALAWPGAGAAAVRRPMSHIAGAKPAPDPIPGGLPVGPVVPGDVIHLFLPGPTDVTLPFSNTTLMGLDVEPSTITDFDGETAFAYLLGSAKGSDGAAYNLEVDIRAFEGEYVAADDSVQRGEFALI
jgi:hypothetical protein